MLKYEWKKLLIYRRGLWMIIVFLLVSLLSVLLLTKPYDRVLEDHREVYFSYLEPMTGPLTEDKRASIEAEMDRLYLVHRQMEQLKQEYYQGDISEEDYQARFPVLLAEDQLYTGFGKLYNQYIFVREQENRYFLYTGGWEVLLTNQTPNYLFLLLLIIVISPVFCEEYSSHMHEILMTQKRSARLQVGVKLCVVLTLTAILTAVLQGMELIYCAAKFGLPNGDFSLQSLYSFGNAAKKLTLWQAFWLQFAFKEIGYCYAAVVIVFLSVLLKKYALTLMAGITVLALPFLTAETNDVFLRLPMPWALTLGSIYLNGSIIQTDPHTGEKVIKVEELSMSEIGWLLMAVLLIAGLMLLYIRHRNTNYQLNRSRPGRIAALACVVVLLFSGCGQSSEPVIYNRSTAGWCETGRFVLLNTQQGVVLIDKETNERCDFPADPFASETVYCNSDFFCADGYAYYIQETRLHPNAGFDTSIITSYLLMQIDLETMSESVRYQWNTERTWFFGLLDKESMEAPPSNVHHFFIHGNELFYLDANENTLFKMSLATGQYEAYLENIASSDISYDGENLYYADAYNRLVIHSLRTGEVCTIDEVIMESFLLTLEGIFFLNRRDNNTLYLWDRESGAVTKLADATGKELYYDAQYLWLFDPIAGSLHRMNHNGTEITTVNVDGNIYAIGSGQYIYYISFADFELCVLDKQSLQ